MFSSVVFMFMADLRCSDDRWVYKNIVDSCLVEKTELLQGYTQNRYLPLICSMTSVDVSICLMQGSG